MPSPNIATETHTVYLSYKGAYGPFWQLVIQAHASWLSKIMDNILLTWIGNAVYYALKFVTQSLLRDVTMIYGTKLRKLC